MGTPSIKFFVSAISVLLRVSAIIKPPIFQYFLEAFGWSFTNLLKLGAFQQIIRRIPMAVFVLSNNFFSRLSNANQTSRIKLSLSVVLSLANEKWTIFFILCWKRLWGSSPKLASNVEVEISTGCKRKLTEKFIKSDRKKCFYNKKAGQKVLTNSNFRSLILQINTI